MSAERSTHPDIRLSTGSRYAVHIGRVGALAIALGIGSAVGAAATAHADRTQTPGPSADHRGASASPSDNNAPRRGFRTGPAASITAGSAARVNAAPAPAATRQASHDVPAGVLSTGADVTTRERGGTTVAAPTPAPRAAAATSTTAVSATASVLASPAPTAATKTVAQQSSTPVLFGNGTAAHPNGGIIIGNGYSYGTVAGDCPSGTCTGGNGGIFGNGGNGYGGGNGGSAGWFGNGGNGGAAANGGAGGNGGRGGVFAGNGGNGGNGGAGGNGAAGQAGGAGGKGGSTGRLSVIGVGGNGGAGGAGGAGADGTGYARVGATGGPGGAGGAGGNGSWVLGLGGNGGAGGNGGGGGDGGIRADGGSGGSGGSGGPGGSGRVLVLFGNQAAGGTGGTGGSGGTGGGVNPGAGAVGAAGSPGSNDGAGGVGGGGGTGGSAGGTARFTPLAQALIQFVNASRADTSGTAASLLTPINYNADIFAATPALLTANYGFEGYIGVPGLDGTTEQYRLLAGTFNVAWDAVDPALGASQRAYFSAVSTSQASSIYGVDLQLADTIPLVFSNPILPTTMSPNDFRVTLSDGSTVTPQAASFLPNLEFNERQTIVLDGEFGNRITPGDPGALYPVSVSVVDDGTPLQMLTALGLVSAVGLSQSSSNPYVTGNGPRLVAAKLNYFSDLGEGGPIGVGSASENNSGSDLYGSQAQYRLRLYTSAGFSPDGIASLLPSEFSRYFALQATLPDGSTVDITQAGTPVTIGGLGTITVVGLADLAPAGTTENAAYVEDHDNYYDVILSGDPAAIARLSSVRLPSAGGYSPVYNPGGPGSDPTAPGAAPGPFTVPSTDGTVAITNDLGGSRVATFVEVDGTVERDPVSGQPVGTLVGTAVEDVVTGQRINLYVDPQGLRFYASFAPAAPV